LENPPYTQVKSDPGVGKMQRLIGLCLLAISLFMTNACRSTGSAAPNSFLPCEIALSEHDGNGKIDEEIRQLQKRIRANPQSLPMMEKLGWSFVAKARESFDPGYYKLAEQCAECLTIHLSADKPASANSNQPGEAAANTQSKQSLKSAALLLRGHVLHNLHRFAEAEKLARELVDLRGLAFDYGLLGDVLMEQGKLDDAVAAYQKMMELKPGPQAYSRAAHVHWLKGDLTGARVLMRMSAQASGQGDADSAAWAWSKLALYELQAGDLKQSRATCELALEIKPGYAPALLASGRVLLAESKFDEAVIVIERASKLNPLPEYHWALAEALRAAGRTGEAQKIEAELALRGANDDPRTVALFLATRGENPEMAANALKLAEEELKQRHDVFTLDALAWAQTAAGKHAEAWQTSQQSLSAGTKDARLYLHAAIIAANAGHPTEARQFIKQAVALQATLLPSEKERLRQLKI